MEYNSIKIIKFMKV